MRRFSMAVSMMVIGMILVMPVKSAIGQTEQEDNNSSLSYSFSYTPVYQFESDLDNGGSFDLHRHYLNLSITRQISKSTTIGLGFKYELEKWNFSDLSNILGATVWDNIHRPGISFPISLSFPNYLTLNLTPAFEWSGESDFEPGKGFISGGTLSLSGPLNKDFYVGVGFGLFDQIEATSFFPIIIIKWQINDRLLLTNPFRVGPAGPAGIELVYLPADEWELGVGGSYRTYRFRLNEDNSVAEGVGQNNFIFAFLRIRRKLSKAMALDFSCGSIFNGQLSLENRNGDKLASDDYDAAPIVALTFSGEF
ncbi:MAG: hypothetical protein GY874_05450 [Desulfobacteraceae bacterium]|nr:hypothetical protein [Desulfobacteraceae bacterium]